VSYLKNKETLSFKETSCQALLSLKDRAVHLQELENNLAMTQGCCRVLLSQIVSCIDYAISASNWYPSPSRNPTGYWTHLVPIMHGTFMPRKSDGWTDCVLV
jgi:hypothetical protein